MITIEFMELVFNGIPDLMKFFHDMLRRTLLIGWIIKTKMKARLHRADKDRTRLIGSTADSDDKVPWLSQILIYMGRNMMTDINPCFMHHLHRQGIDPIGWLRTRRKDLDPRIHGL